MAKSYMAKPGELKARWHLVDAANQILGRMASRIALVLQGKHRPTYTPHVDTGDFVVVVNASKIRVTGRKLKQRLVYRGTRYPGHLRATPLGEVLAKKPAQVIREAVRRMLPKSKLGDHMLGKLKVFGGPEHLHQAQDPKPLVLS